MPLPIFTPAETVFEFSLAYRVNGQVCRNFWHYRNRDQIPASNVLDVQELLVVALMTDVLGDWPRLFAAAMGNNVLIFESAVQAVFPAPRIRKSVETMELQGEIDNAVSAQNVQGSLTKFGVEANRKNRGGMRIGGLPPAGYELGFLTNGQKTAYQAIADVIFVPFSETIDAVVEWFDPVILNRTNTGTVDNPIWVNSGSTLITEFVVEETVRTQRSRTVGRGE